MAMPLKVMALLPTTTMASMKIPNKITMMSMSTTTTTHHLKKNHRYPSFSTSSILPFSSTRLHQQHRSSSQWYDNPALFQHINSFQRNKEPFSFFSSTSSLTLKGSLSSTSLASFLFSPSYSGEEEEEKGTAGRRRNPKDGEKQRNDIESKKGVRKQYELGTGVNAPVMNSKQEEGRDYTVVEVDGSNKSSGMKVEATDKSQNIKKKRVKYVLGGNAPVMSPKQNEDTVVEGDGSNKSSGMKVEATDKSKDEKKKRVKYVLGSATGFQEGGEPKSNDNDSARGHYWNSIYADTKKENNNTSTSSSNSVGLNNKTHDGNRISQNRVGETSNTIRSDGNIDDDGEEEINWADKLRKRKTSTYEFGIGKNLPINEVMVMSDSKFRIVLTDDGTDNKKDSNIIDSDNKEGNIASKTKSKRRSSEGSYLSRALWFYGHDKPSVEERNDSNAAFSDSISATTTGNDRKEISNENENEFSLQQRETQQQQYGYSGVNDNNSNNLPPVKYEDIDLSIPESVYSPNSIITPKSTTTPEKIDLVWSLMRHEARVEAQREPLLVSFLHSTILNHPTLESALAFHLANHLSSPSMISTQLMALIMEALDNDQNFRTSLRADIMAVRDRDPACTCLPDVFLYFKGFHALQCHRVGNYLWKNGRRTLAHYLQSQVSQNFQIDIHPNASFGRGIMLDHGTGIVVGETAVVGDNCSLLHHVTLGGSGKKGVDRHPKVGKGVLLGAGCSVLGNIKIGNGCQVGAGTLVIGDLPSHSVAVGVPCKVIGTFRDETEQPSTNMNQLGSKEANATIATFETYGI